MTLSTQTASLADQSLWFPYVKTMPGTRLRLFCIPYAGGSASLYRQWQQAVPRGVQVYAVQLPGRETRTQETPHRKITSLVPELAQVLRPYLDQPFAIFGHSMGALIAFELVRQLRREGLPLPHHLFISGHRAPQLPYRLPHIHNMQRDELIAALRDLNSVPEEILNNEAFLSLYLPLLQADFALCEHYRYVEEPRLDCSCSVFGGLQDHRVTHQELAAWRNQINGPYLLQMFRGDHFFLQSLQGQLLDTISSVLYRLMLQ